jgi:hypothetical protein
MKNYREIYNSEQIIQLLSLVDGAKVTIELFKAESPYQIKWKEEWLKTARELLKLADNSN